MTRPVDYRSYPPAFITLIERASVASVEIECCSEGKAKSLQGRLHQFIGVLHRNAAADKNLLQLDSMSRRVKIMTSGTKLLAIPRDEEEDNLIVLKGLLSNSSTPSPELTTGNMSPEMAEMFAQALTTDKN